MANYTQATGKRPDSQKTGWGSKVFVWGYEGQHDDFPDAPPLPGEALLPEAVFDLLPPEEICGTACVVTTYPTESAALAAADAAYERAVAEGAMGPIEGVA